MKKKKLGLGGLCWVGLCCVESWSWYGIVGRLVRKLNGKKFLFVASNILDVSGWEDV